MISSIIIDDVSLKQSCRLGSGLMSLVPQRNIYASEDGSISNPSFICFKVYIIFSTSAFVCDGSNISVLTCFVTVSN